MKKLINIFLLIALLSVQVFAASNITSPTTSFVGNDPNQDGGRIALISGLVAHWKMNDDLATTNVVESYVENNGTADQNTENMNAVGKINDALSFNGSSDEVTVAYDSSFNISTSWSMSAWVKTNSHTGMIAINGAATWNCYIFVNADGKAQASIVTAGQHNVVSVADANDDAWHHIVGTYDGSDLKVYLDTTVATNATPNGAVRDHAGQDFYIGSTGGGTYFDGEIDDLRMYNTALTSTEVATLYNSGSGTESQFAAGNPNAGGGCTTATFTTLDKVMGANGAVLHNNAGCTISGSFGSDVVVNGSFDSDTVWDKDVSWAIGGGTANHDGTAQDIIEQATILTSGKQYIITADITNYTGSGTLGLATATGTVISGTNTRSSNGAIDCVVLSNGNPLGFFGRTTNTHSLDNVIATEILGVVLTDAGNFATGLEGVLVNCDFSATYDDGVYPITASTANSITIDLAWSTDVPTAEVWVGGAFPSIADALADDSTDAASYVRNICSNLDDTLAAKLVPPGASRSANTHLRLIGYHTKLYYPAEDASDDRIISDMDIDSLVGDYAAQFSTSYHGGSTEAGRIENSLVQERANATWVTLDFDDIADDAINISGDNIEFRNFSIFGTDRAADHDLIVAGAAYQGTTFVNCRLNDADDLIGGSTNLAESIFIDTYFGADIDNARTSFGGCEDSLFLNCFFDGNGQTEAAGFIFNSTVIGCIFYKSTNGLLTQTGTVHVINCVFFDQTSKCLSLDNAAKTICVYNNIFSPAAAADRVVWIGDTGTLVGDNNIAYSATAGAVLTQPYYNNGTSAEFWLRNTTEEDPLFEDDTNLDFRVGTGSPAINAGLGKDGDIGYSSIGLDALTRAGSGGGGGGHIIGSGVVR